tara:strand:- start:812 stop:952 length:141 start_codon:yes stop_codon:yes gene_type:complete
MTDNKSEYLLLFSKYDRKFAPDKITEIVETALGFIDENATDDLNEA